MALALAAHCGPVCWACRGDSSDGMKHSVGGRRRRLCAFVLGLCCTDARPLAPFMLAF